jgi:hypothetical protein
MKRPFGAALGVTFVLALGSPAAAQAPRLSIDDDTWLQIGFLAQLQFESAANAAGVDGAERSYDFFARRIRVMGRGSIHRNVKFWFSTDIPNAGKSGVANGIVWNDGFIDVQLRPEINLAMGRFLVPFSPENRASAGSLLGIDYNMNLLKIPTFVDRAFWRDDGIELRGVLFGGLVEYRGGLFRGARSVNLAGPGEPVRLNNPDQHLRTIGMVMINLADAQPGWFYNPNSLGALTVLSVGAGYDRIPNSAEGIDNSQAWNVFAMVEQPVGKGRVNALAAYYDWDGPAWAGGAFEGQTMGVQVGYLLPVVFLDGKWQPVVRVQRQDNPDADFTLNTVNLGLNYLLKGHAINFKLDYAINNRRVAGENVDAVCFQAQLLF